VSEGTAAVLGLDLGTGGARAVVANLDGELLARGGRSLPPAAVHREGERHEQDAGAWWQAARGAVREAVASLPAASPPIRALSVDGTSGTIVGVDEEGRPTTAGLMYNDGRAARLAPAPGPRPAAPPALLRMLWVAEQCPDAFARTRTFLHQADFVAGRLCGAFGISDSSNALKSGYDLRAQAWGEAARERGELLERLPRVVAPGSELGGLTPEAADELGLTPETRVVAGVTDGTAGFLASGARRVGDDSTTLGTTLVFKRLASHLVEDPDGRVYCHGLPGDLWIPGAASSTGGEWIRRDFPGADLRALDHAVAESFPCDVLAYPLVGRGERFPFSSPEARGFLEPPPGSELERYAAMLQGTALFEALAYELLDRLTGANGGEVFVTGGGSRSDVWLQLRADVTGRRLHRPRHPESAFGSAVLAAAGWLGEPLPRVCERMVGLERSFHPDPERTRRFAPYHARFREALRRRGHLPEGAQA